MTNNLNEKQNNRIKIAAVVAAFVFALAALITGLVLGINKRQRQESQDGVARYLLVDAAGELNHTMSALRLCNEKETALSLCNDGLVYAVRAETALECANDDFSENRAKEAFLNDIAAVLHTKDPMQAAKKADMLYKYSNMFYDHVSGGKPFDYNGELAEQEAKPRALKDEKTDEKTERAEEKETINEAESAVKKALKADSVKHVGSFNGRLEFEVEREGKNGYATVEGDKIIEFSFVRGGGKDVDKNSAEMIAKDTAKLCGYADLNVCSIDINDGFAVVKLCKNIDGALACDECASVVVAGDNAVAFSAGKCNCNHDVPDVKVSESEARKAAPLGARSTGVLVTRKVDGKERVCYEYVYDLEDGVHYVYVCAVNGRQMQVK